ncbi:phosphotransferase [Devosia sp.]|uniref:phosphotransferase n=1 Tax=Devosia sp. TaxID=1871048 RepID=UPI0032639731
MSADAEVPLAGGGRTKVVRNGDVVHRQTGPWAQTVHALLRHFEAVSFVGAPRVIGSGFDDRGRETLSFIEGTSPHPGPWTDAALPALGALLRQMHIASASFKIPENAIWRDWFGRSLGDGPKVIGHCDTGDWNIIAEAGHPVALIDWEQAGPVDPLVELAQLCWLNAHLFDDDLAAHIGLPPLADRARKLRLIVEGYGLAAAQRRGLVETMIHLAIHDTANEARQAAITMASTDPTPLWALAWRSRSAAWMLSHRGELERALR